MDDSSAPATKADLREVKDELREVKDDLREVKDDLREVKDELREVKDELREVEAQLRSEFQHGFDDLKEAFRDGQTELLKAFYSFAEGSNKRMTELEWNETAVRSRLATLEERLLEVEKRLNMPPAA